MLLPLAIVALAAAVPADALPAGTRPAGDGAARREGAELELAVSDDGPGVPPEHLARLFEPYFTTKVGGTGLGLAISERIVREQGGRIEVRSTPGQGATFAVRLPLAATGPTGPGSP